MSRLTIEIDDETAGMVAKIAQGQQMSQEQAATYLLERTLFGIVRSNAVPFDQYKPESVLVMVDENADTILKKYRCNTCGNIVFEYCGSTKLVMNGRYDRENMMIDGENIQVPEFGPPTLIVCQGRIAVSYPNGRSGKVRCGSKYYKLRA